MDGFISADFFLGDIYCGGEQTFARLSSENFHSIIIVRITEGCYHLSTSFTIR